MNNQFFDQRVFSGFENPMQKLMELNVKMLQNLSYMKPLDLLSLKKPEEILEKQMEMFVQNGHVALNYMRDSFSILESNWSNVSRNVDKNTKKFVSEVSSTVKKKPVSAKKHGPAVKSASSTKSVNSSPKKEVKAAPSSHTHTQSNAQQVNSLSDKSPGTQNTSKSNPLSK